MIDNNRIRFVKLKVLSEKYHNFLVKGCTTDSETSVSYLDISIEKYVNGFLNYTIKLT